MGLAVPLTKDQIVAAKRLHARLMQWRAADAALAAVSDRFARASPFEVER